MNDLHISRVLNSSTLVDNAVIYDLERQIPYLEDDDSSSDDNARGFLDKVRHYLVGDGISIETREKFEEFLNTIFSSN